MAWYRTTPSLVSLCSTRVGQRKLFIRLSFVGPVCLASGSVTHVKPVCIGAKTMQVLEHGPSNRAQQQKLTASVRSLCWVTDSKPSCRAHLGPGAASVVALSATHTIAAQQVF